MMESWTMTGVSRSEASTHSGEGSPLLPGEMHETRSTVAATKRSRAAELRAAGAAAAITRRRQTHVASGHAIRTRAECGGAAGAAAGVGVVVAKAARKDTRAAGSSRAIGYTGTATKAADKRSEHIGRAEISR